MAYFSKSSNYDHSRPSRSSPSALTTSPFMSTACSVQREPCWSNNVQKSGSGINSHRTFRTAFTSDTKLSCREGESSYIIHYIKRLIIKTNLTESSWLKSRSKLQETIWNFIPYVFNFLVRFLKNSVGGTLDSKSSRFEVQAPAWELCLPSVW